MKPVATARKGTRDASREFHTGGAMKKLGYLVAIVGGGTVMGIALGWWLG